VKVTAPKLLEENKSDCRSFLWRVYQAIFAELKWTLPTRLICGLNATDAAYAAVTQSKKQGISSYWRVKPKRLRLTLAGL
jgi:hypothetical protein